MEHSFDVDVAVKYGFAVAILLKHFHFWCERNKDNDIHLHDGRYWTYLSVRSLMEAFPYLTKYQIVQALKDMVKENLIIEGNFPNKANRSKWYALTENGQCICRNQLMHLPKSTNALTENEQCIVRNQTMHCSKSDNAYTDIYINNISHTDIDTDTINTDIDTDSDSARPKKTKPVRHRYGEYKNVLLSDADIEKLDEYEPNWRVTMENMSEYCESHGKTYKNYYATIRNWIKKDRERRQAFSSDSLIRGHDELSAGYQMAHRWAESEGDDE